MTVSTTSNIVSASGDGSTHSFAYAFPIFVDGDLTVIIRSSAGTETTKVLDTHYIVTGAGTASGGNVLFKYNTGNSSDAHYSATDYRPASGETVVIKRVLGLTQATDWVENDPFPATDHENATDRLTLITQQLQEAIDRKFGLSATTSITSGEITDNAADRASKVIAFTSDGQGLEAGTSIGTLQGNWAASTAYVVRDLVKDTSNNNIYFANTAHTSSGSQPISSNTDSAKWTLIVDAASATTSATAAATSATAAATSATAAATSATAAATSATTATTQASASSTSATAAAASATAAAASADAFDDTYLGAKSSDPSVDNDGDALTAGDLYFNTSSDVMRVYTGSAWSTAAADTSTFVTTADAEATSVALAIALGG